MIPHKANLTMRILDSSEVPHDRWCKSGHVADQIFINDAGKQTPMRFYSVSGDKDLLPIDRHGIYCETCIAKATVLAQVFKKAGLR